MKNVQSIKLASHGDYWLARYYDNFGRRRGKVLGPKADIGRRQALVLCERLAVELQVQPGKAEIGKAPTLAAWIESFLAAKPDLGEAAKRAYMLAADKFKVFAGAETRIDRITPAAAGEFTTSLAAETDGKRLSPASVANYARHLRCLFNEAVHQRLLLANPFARIRTQPKSIDRKWHQVTREAFRHVLVHCPNDAWRCFLALQRIGGLRKGEASLTKWKMIDWQSRVLILPASITKTGQERIVPLDPELFGTLKVAYDQREPGEACIVPESLVDQSSDSNQHKRFKTILKRAGIEPWEDLFQTLRRNAVQDLRESLKDSWAVTAIAGHSEEVERKYYLGRVRQSDLDRVTGLGDEAEIGEITSLVRSLSPGQRRALWCSLQNEHKR